jgi:histidine ammonia-lyase
MTMAPALKAPRAVQIARQVLAVELLCAAQAIDLLAPLATSAPLSRVHETIRAHVPPLDADRPPAPDIAAIDALIAPRRRRTLRGARCQVTDADFSN